MAPGRGSGRWHVGVLLLLAAVCMPAGSQRLADTSADSLAVNATHVARRLVSFSGIFSEASAMAAKASQWVADTGKTIAVGVGKALGLDKVLAVLKEGSRFVSDGIAVAGAAWRGMKNMVSALIAIFTEFTPLQPVFANKNGLLTLLTSAGNLKILVKTIESLLGTSDALTLLSNALQKASDVFSKLSNFFAKVLAVVAGSRRRLDASIADDPISAEWVTAERRLLDFTSLLSGLDFTGMLASFKVFIQQLPGFSATLTQLNQTFGPLLSQMDSMLTAAGPPAVTGGRRLAFDALVADQKKYAAAIKQVIPTWQGVEALSIQMCPFVLNAQDSVSSLACRVQGFVDKAGLFSSISTLVSGCGADPINSTAIVALARGCPNVSMSAGVQDLIGANADALGWIIAVVVAAAGCCGCAALGLGAAVKMKSNGEAIGDEDEEEEAEEEEEEGELYEEDELHPTENSRG